MHGKEMVIAYPLNQGLYLNITNRCPNACLFCIRQTAHGVGYDLWLEHEPTVTEITAAIGNPSGYREVVFCGYGEPLTRPEVVVEVSRWVKQFAVPVRLNTNGLADLFLGYDILPQLAGLIDVISISLNAEDAAAYARITQSQYGLKAYPALLDFVKRSRNYIPKVVVSAVDYPGINLDNIGKVAKSLGVAYRIRSFQQ
ncbi:MAG TPA: TatD family nuclease-associated radical SAM protein [Bacillota bacterium]